MKTLKIILFIVCFSYLDLYSQNQISGNNSLMNIIVNQKYQQADSLSLPLHLFPMLLFKFSGVETTIDSPKIHTIMTIDLSGQPVKLFYSGSGELYTGAIVKGKITTNIPGKKRVVRSFSGTEGTPIVLHVFEDSKIDSLKKPDGAPFGSALGLKGSYFVIMLKVFRDIYGMKPIDSALNYLYNLKLENKITEFERRMLNAAYNFVWKERYDHKCFDTLMTAVNGNNNIFKYDAIEQLPSTGDKRAFDVLYKLYKEKNTYLAKSSILKGLRSCKDKRMLSILLDELYNQFDWDVIYSFDDFGKEGADSLLVLLNHGLNSKNAVLIKNTVGALDYLKDKRAVELIIKALEFGKEIDNFDVTWASRCALQDMTGQSFDNDLEKWQQWWSKFGNKHK